MFNKVRGAPSHRTTLGERLEVIALKGEEKEKEEEEEDDDEEEEEEEEEGGEEDEFEEYEEELQITSVNRRVRIIGEIPGIHSSTRKEYPSPYNKTSEHGVTDPSVLSSSSVYPSPDEAILLDSASTMMNRIDKLDLESTRTRDIKRIRSSIAMDGKSSGAEIHARCVVV